MSKFKVGDKVVRVIDIDYFVDKTGEVSGVVAYVTSYGFIKVSGCAFEWDSRRFELAQDEWSVYNNDKPLYELTDEQRGLLFTMLCNGSPMQYKLGDKWEDRLKGSPLINTNSTYRVKKQETERELFIEAALSSCVIHKDIESMMITFSEMFDAGFKAPERDE